MNNSAKASSAVVRTPMIPRSLPLLFLFFLRDPKRQKLQYCTKNIQKHLERSQKLQWNCLISNITFIFFNIMDESFIFTLFFSDVYSSNGFKHQRRCFDLLVFLVIVFTVILLVHSWWFIFLEPIQLLTRTESYHHIMCMKWADASRLSLLHVILSGVFFFYYYFDLKAAVKWWQDSAPWPF